MILKEQSQGILSYFDRRRQNYRLIEWNLKTILYKARKTPKRRLLRMEKINTDDKLRTWKMQAKFFEDAQTVT